MDHRRWLVGAAAALAVGLWGSAPLIAVMFGEPPPTRRRALRAAAEIGVSMISGALFGVLSSQTAASLAAALVTRFLGVTVAVDAVLAGVIVAVVITGVGPSFLRWLEGRLRAKVAEGLQ